MSILSQGRFGCETRCGARRNRRASGCDRWIAPGGGSIRLFHFREPGFGGAAGIAFRRESSASASRYPLTTVPSGRTIVGVPVILSVWASLKLSAGAVVLHAAEGSFRPA